MGSAFSIIIFVLMAVAFLIAMSLSGNGSPSGLGVISGQDLEIFKRTKDRGAVKILQIILFMVILLVIIALVVYQLVISEEVPPPVDPEEATASVKVIFRRL